MNQSLKNYFSGLSGIELPVPKYQFPLEYRESSRLSYYATFFNTIEVNNTFYKMPRTATLEKWALSVPPHFRFTFKFFKEVTHAKNLLFDSSHIRPFLDSISGVGMKKGCLLLQFPPSLKAENLHQLENLLGIIQMEDRDENWRVAVEFRDPGWYNPDAYHLLDSYQSSLVLHDMRASATPIGRIDSPIMYVRFHGPTGNYRGSYSESFLKHYAAKVRHWLLEGRVVYVYFNNTAGDAFNNLVTFNSLVSDELIE